MQHMQQLQYVCKDYMHTHKKVQQKITGVTIGQCNIAIRKNAQSTPNILEKH